MILLRSILLYHYYPGKTNGSVVLCNDLKEKINTRVFPQFEDLPIIAVTVLYDTLHYK